MKTLQKKPLAGDDDQGLEDPALGGLLRREIPDYRRNSGDFQAKIDPCPTPLKVLPGGIPDELKSFPQWVLWRYEQSGGRWTKPPFRPNGRKASKTDPAHFSTFDEVMAAYQAGGFAGLGFVLTTADPLVAVDLDHCLTGYSITDEAQAIIEELSSYTEISPSGTGLHIFVKGEIPRNTKKPGIEIYSQSFYVTVTGQRWLL